MNNDFAFTVKNLPFSYKGKTFKGLLVMSGGEYPHFFWFYPDDPQLSREVSECLSFKVEPDTPVVLTEPGPPELVELCEAIRTAIEPYVVTHRETGLGPKP